MQCLLKHDCSPTHKLIGRATTAVWVGAQLQNTWIRYPVGCAHLMVARARHLSKTRAASRSCMRTPQTYNMPFGVDAKRAGIACIFVCVCIWFSLGSIVERALRCALFDGIRSATVRTPLDLVFSVLMIVSQSACAVNLFDVRRDPNRHIQ